MARADRLLVTCEHAGNRVPRAYAGLFRGKQRLLTSHRGWDPGALDLAATIARRLAAPLLISETTRLLVDLNRSVTNRAVFSDVTRRLDAASKQRILEQYYDPHRERVSRSVAGHVTRGRRVVHLAVHTFTPVRGGNVRRADIGLLYDPARSTETALCAGWRLRLRARQARLRIRSNYPYRGVADGLTTALRRRFSPSLYVGIELEVNQKHFRGARRNWLELKGVIVETLGAAIGRG